MAPAANAVATFNVRIGFVIQLSRVMVAILRASIYSGNAALTPNAHVFKN